MSGPSVSGVAWERLRSLWPALTLFVVFLWPQLILRDSFVLYDFALQHLPWASQLARSLSMGAMPWWVDGMGGGFPLVAEGQVGAFYPPHLIAYRSLPFWPAYTWMVPAHFALAIGLMYLYVRRMGLSRSAAGLAATLFAFGAGYAGCFLNTAALKVLCWTPAGLLLDERARDGSAGKGGRYLAWAGLSLVVALQWTAGAAQMAAYACGYYAAHAFIRGWADGRMRAALSAVAGTLLCIGLGAGMAAIQIGPSLELMRISARGDQGAAFALWGSVLPVAPLTLLFPEWGNTLRYSFYVGLLPLLLVALSLTVRDRRLTAQLWLAGLFLLLAFGKYNPVYRSLIELTGWTFFRGPYKLLFFVMLQLAVMAAYGWDAYHADRADGPVRRRAVRVAWIILILTLCLPAIALSLQVLSERYLPDLSLRLATRIVAEKGDQAKPIDYYLGVIGSYLAFFRRLFSYGNPLNWQQIAVAAALLAALRRRHAPASQARIPVILLAVLVWDLGVFGYTQGTGFLGNTAAIRSAQEPGVPEAARPSPQGRYAERMGGQSRERLPANAGLTYDIAQAGAYSPLLLRSYHELARPLSLTDDSLGRTAENSAVWGNAEGLVDLLGIAILREPLSSGGRDGWSVVARDEEAVYRANEDPLEELTVYSDWIVQPDPGSRLRYLSSSDFDAWAVVVAGSTADVAGLTAHPGRRAVPASRLPSDGSARVYRLRSTEGGVALFRQCAYPGWTLRVDGRPRDWFVVDHAFIGFKVGPGDRQVELTYTPTGLRGWIISSLIAWLAWGALVVSALRDRRRSHFLSHLTHRRI